MRLRNATLAAASAIALVLAVPASAGAATGDFLYKVGRGAETGLADPVSGECVDLPGATTGVPAFAPENHTRSTATAYLDFDCAGDVFFVMLPGKKYGNRLHLRSVVFS
ncbi:hypothetical protein [Kitasatospora sp. NPDC005748]|uniref:hypothetical protein n=1 Tax=Kitasatospora sp. NPDC005748 TaxID=3157063 RepID=UPI0033EEA47D